MRREIRGKDHWQFKDEKKEHRTKVSSNFFFFWRKKVSSN